MNQLFVIMKFVYALEIIYHSDYFIRHQFMNSSIFGNKSKYSYNSNGFDVQGENEDKINEIEIYLCSK